MYCSLDNKIDNMKEMDWQCLVNIASLISKKRSIDAFIILGQNVNYWSELHAAKKPGFIQR